MQKDRPGKEKEAKKSKNANSPKRKKAPDRCRRTAEGQTEACRKKKHSKKKQAELKKERERLQKAKERERKRIRCVCPRKRKSRNRTNKDRQGKEKIYGVLERIKAMAKTQELKPVITSLLYLLSSIVIFMLVVFAWFTLTNVSNVALIARSRASRSRISVLRLP